MPRDACVNMVFGFQRKLPRVLLPQPEKFERSVDGASRHVVDGLGQTAGAVVGSGLELGDRAPACHAGTAAPVAIHVAGQVRATADGDLILAAGDRRAGCFTRNSIRGPFFTQVRKDLLMLPPIPRQAVRIDHARRLAVRRPETTTPAQGRGCGRSVTSTGLLLAPADAGTEQAERQKPKGSGFRDFSNAGVDHYLLAVRRQAERIAAGEFLL